MRYESIPHEVEALQFNAMTIAQIPDFVGCTNMQLTIKDGAFNALITVGGIKMLVIQNDYIVKDGQEVLILKQKEFETSYRKVEGD